MKRQIQYSKTKSIILTSMFISIGLLFPYIMGHAAGIPGTVLLPMHIPVLLCGYICGSRWGLAAGVLTPVLSSLLTGMPPFFPVLPMMVGELGLYGWFSGFSFRKLKWPVLLSLPVTMILGRIVSGIIFAAVTLPESPAAVAASVWTSLVTGVPGIIIQLILIPVLVTAVDKLSSGAMPSLAAQKSPGPDAALADKVLDNPEYTCAIAKNGEVIFKTQGIGVSPLVRLYESEQGKEMLSGCALADTVIGKGAAVILVLAGAKEVHGRLMSKSACGFLEQHNVVYSYANLVEYIQNRTMDGVCPIEQSVMNIDSAKEGYAAVKNTIADLMSQKAQKDVSEQ